MLSTAWMIFTGQAPRERWNTGSAHDARTNPGTAADNAVRRVRGHTRPSLPSALRYPFAAAWTPTAAGVRAPWPARRDFPVRPAAPSRRHAPGPGYRQ